MTINVGVAQSISLNQEKISADTEKLLNLIEESIKIPKAINFSLNSAFTLRNKLFSENKKLHKKLLSDYKKSPNNEDVHIALATYYKSIKDTIQAKKFYKKSYGILSERHPIKDSITHFLKLSVVKGELGLNFYPEINILKKIGLLAPPETYNKYGGFLFIIYLENGNYELVKQKAKLLLETQSVTKPEIIFSALIYALIYEKKKKFGKQEFLLLDSYANRYKNNKNIQSLAKLARLYPFYFKWGKDNLNMPIEKITLSKQDISTLKSLKEHIFKMFRKHQISNFYHHYYLGHVNFFSKDIDTSIYYFEKAVSIAFKTSQKSEDLVTLFETLVTLYTLKKEYSGLRKTLDYKSDIFKNDKKVIAQNFYLKALTFLKEKNYKEANIWVNKALNTNPKNANILSLKAHLEFIKKEYQIVEPHMISAINNTSTEHNLFNRYFQLTIYTMLLQQVENAFNWFLEALHAAKDENELKKIKEIGKAYFK